MTALRYNIVLVLTDDQPPGSLNRMPYLSSKPHGNWLTMSNAFLHMPQCAPSRASIFTGLYEERHGVKSNTLAGAVLNAGLNETLMLAPTLARAGYHNGLFGKYENKYPWVGVGGSPTWQPVGWHDWHAFADDDNSTYENFAMVENRKVVAYPGTSYSTDVMAAQATQFIATAREPFFVHFAPHAPHKDGNVSGAVPAPRHAGLYPGEVERRPNFNPVSIADKPRWMQDAYPVQWDSATVTTWDNWRRDAWRALAAVDDAINAIIAAVDARGALDRTIIVVMTDNGNLFLEHRHQDKTVMYEEAINAQMMLRWPGALQRTATPLISNVDLAPTFCEIAGTVMPLLPDGMSMVPLLTGDRPEDRWRTALYFSILGVSTDQGSRMIRTSRWKYTLFHNSHLFYGTDWDDEELYDIVADPYEMVNLAADTSLAGVKASMRAKLDRLTP